MTAKTRSLNKSHTPGIRVSVAEASQLDESPSPIGNASLTPSLISTKSKRLSAGSETDPVLNKLVTPNNPSVESIRQSMQRSALDNKIKEEINTTFDFSQIDQKKIPLFLIEMEGQSSLQATLSCLSEKDIVRLADFSRDPKDPNCFPDRILVDMTIKKQAQSSEIEYFIFLSKYAEITNE